MSTNDTMARIADARIARALRAIRDSAEKVLDDEGRQINEGRPRIYLMSLDVDAGLASLEAAAPPSEPPAARDPLPPLEGPLGFCNYASELPGDTLVVPLNCTIEWERIARAERAARERERAELAARHEVVVRHTANANYWAERAGKAERERDEAQATAARLAVERNALREQRDAALKALGE